MTTAAIPPVHPGEILADDLEVAKDSLGDTLARVEPLRTAS